MPTRSGASLPWHDAHERAKYRAYFSAQGAILSVSGVPHRSRFPRALRCAQSVVV